MPLQVVCRIICNQCGLEVGRPGIVTPNQPLPLTVNVNIPVIPDGWTLNGTDTRCPAHASRIIEPVGPVPDSVLRGN